MAKRSKPYKRRNVRISWLKVLSGLIGIALTILGWAISNVEHLGIVKSIVAPKYDVAIKTWTKMTIEGFVLKSGQSGFIEMRELFNHARQTLTPKEGERKLPPKVCILKVELSGIMHGPGGLDEKIAVFRNTDYLDS
ncbi:MAG: hypothetical protein HF981_19600, partial [Desulfobacteraceae bacterium]|nr:hypothetical protein [Desulfobacteraceae bacterium]MBC2752607.1 hypothetical protein [Desulfobacteraceae bacterium]